MQKPLEPVRLSVYQAGLELKITFNKIKAALRANGIAPGEDGKFSLREIFTALQSPNGLETKAKEARLQKIIDEAEVARLKRRREENRLIEWEPVVRWINDMQVTIFTAIRHSLLSKDEQQNLIDSIRQINLPDPEKEKKKKKA
jgi:hypothetical protein